MNYNQFSNLSCYEEFEIQCDLLGISKLDILKKHRNKIDNYYFFISNKRLIKSHFYLRNGNYIEMDKNETNSILTFILVYFVIFFFGSFLISLFGFNFGESAFEYASALGGVGLSVGIVSASANPGVLWIIMGGMFFGRLEIFIIFQAILRMVNDIRKKEC